MSKRILYRCYESNKLNDIICRTPFSECISTEPKLHYGLLPQTKSVVYTICDGAHLIQLLNTVDYFNGIWITEPFIIRKNNKMDKLINWQLRYVPAGKEYGKRMKWEDFKKITKTYTYVAEPDVEKFTFAQLMKMLSAEEFIEYCKDRGLNAVPIVK